MPDKKNRTTLEIVQQYGKAITTFVAIGTLAMTLIVGSYVKLSILPDHDEQIKTFVGKMFFSKLEGELMKKDIEYIKKGIDENSQLLKEIKESLK